ncbi:hypothetical protein Gotri_023006 [Gossypium trilobum]|uniref:Coiled-coil domain-containing protein n=1 Tax=Gossypium trilobum TaxID=34281 RepID=A0A7J9DHQ1_9ROSI|nr:hypothetical protein [Gossypium trilobum]
MPKKMGVNSKAEAARARKSATEAERKDREAREKEEQYWREAEKEIEKALKKPDKKANRVAIPVPKVTEAELQKRKEEEQAEMAKKAEEAKKRQSRTAAEEEYERMVLVTNMNRDDSLIEARSVEEAIAQMSVADTLPPDRHPERRLKASFKAFEEAELPRLKEEKPGLTHNQYKDMIWKLWKKSPDNPLNQARVANLESPTKRIEAANLEAACVGWNRSQNKYLWRFEQRLAKGVQCSVPFPQQAFLTSERLTGILRVINNRFCDVKCISKRILNVLVFVAEVAH